MTIYNINFGIGWANSGVEYAQLYRAKLLRELKEDVKFIFLDFFNHENIQTLTENLGFYDDEIIWLYQYFTDIQIAPTTYTVEDIIKTLGSEINDIEYKNKTAKIIYNKKQNYILCYLKEEGNNIVNRASYVSRGKLIRKDYYSYVRVYSEYYAPYDNVSQLYMRQFYNKNGSIAFSEYIEDGEHIYKLPDQIVYSKQSFIAHFIKKLALTSKDMIILDRSLKVAQAIVQNKGEAKLGVAIHAEHFNKNETNEYNILWNNYYEYPFNKSENIDFFITSTEKQNEILSKQFQTYYNLSPKIYTIPVGSLSKLIYPKVRKPYSLMTASRLASEKHINWLIKAVIIVQKYYPKMTFDIFGEGKEKSYLQNIIESNQATSYITLKGHTDLENVYSNYELFLSGSTSEGFGLTLMEAVGSGLGMIGFDVNYGNPTFISDHKNGYLVPIRLDSESENVIIDNIANAIMKFFENKSQNFQEASYNIAESFKTPIVQEKWRNLIKEVLYD